jgi:hypothetical protein
MRRALDSLSNTSVKISIIIIIGILQEWSHTLVILALRMLRQKGFEFEVTLGSKQNK